MDNKSRPGRSSDLIAKEHKEMRTSSATAGNTNTEYKLLNMNMTGGLNLTNQKNFMLGGGNSVTHAISKMAGEPQVSTTNYSNKMISSKQTTKPSSVNGKKMNAKNRTLGSNGGQMNLNLPMDSLRSGGHATNYSQMNIYGAQQ